MFGALGLAYCKCGPNANWFVQEWFGDCIYTTWELAAFWIGMSSVLFWIVAQLPQFISNMKNQSAEALSPWFLLQWLAGDSFNLLGCFLTGDQLVTQTFTAAYFIFADCIIICQYMYYTVREEEKVVFEAKDQGSSTSVPHHHIAEFKESRKETPSGFWKSLPKISIVATDLGDDSEVNSGAQHEGHQYHTFSSVTGRSGASLMSKANHCPEALDSAHWDNPNTASQTSPLASIPECAEEGPEGDRIEPNLNAQCRPVTERSAASKIARVLHYSHNPLLDQINRASQTGTSSCTDVSLPGTSNRQCQAFAKSEGQAEAFAERSDRRIGRFQRTKERNQQSRKSAERLGTIPAISVEQLFPTANAMKRHLRRLANQYGLECGPPSGSKLVIHRAQSLEKHEVEKQIMGRIVTSKLGSGLNKRPIKAAACLASLLTVNKSTNFFQKSVTSGPSQTLAFGSRRLLADVPYSGPGISISSLSSTLRTGRSLFLICGDGQRPWWLRSFGNCLGWGSSGLYFGSRFAQIAMNYQRRSAEGLSLAMLSCAILANTCMGVSILMRSNSLEDLAIKAPWLVGSLGTVALDVFILLQAKYLEMRCTKPSSTVPDERTYLLA